MTAPKCNACGQPSVIYNHGRGISYNQIYATISVTGTNAVFWKLCTKCFRGVTKFLQGIKQQALEDKKREIHTKKNKHGRYDLAIRDVKETIYVGYDVW